LGKVERQFPDELVIIGVHSAKFPAERAGGSRRSAIQRYDIEHPVINDVDFDAWSQYAVRAWPTLIFIDPEGRIIGRHEGEASAEALAEAVERMVDEYDKEELISRGSIPGIARMSRPSGALDFPGKILADPGGNRLFIADSGHNRIVVTRLDGSEPWVMSTGREGLVDGDMGSAAFHHPQGLALTGDVLYVADTRNHAIRRIDLAAQRVETIAGTGEPGMSYAAAGPARTIDLRSPWDIVLQGRVLYIAMAGMHQLWALDLDQSRLCPYAGNGREGIRDGSLESAWLAQPSGIDTDGRRLYFADSETSAIRIADLPPRDMVQTIVGIGLFDFGDADGIGEEVRLQHPLGLVVGDGIVYVADTYNHKIKRLYPAERRCETWLGAGQPGNADGLGEQARFHEPGGVSIAGDTLYIADTNNHAIRVAELGTGRVTTLEVRL
jgi:NHL repeat